MPSSHTDAFLERFRLEAGPDSRLAFDAFIRLALYDPVLGYYAARRTRVGRSAQADFYTASSLGSLFGELVAAAAAKLLRDRGLDPAAHVFTEIGAETGGGVLAGVAHPFRGVEVLRLGEALEFGGERVLFSNELLDAQPCRRFRRGEAGWTELGVRLAGEGLEECELGLVSELWLPESAPLGYVLDAPREAAALAGRLAGQAWTGLFLAFDYGTGAAALASEFPSGTLRAYRQHQQNNRLLEHPGEQDLTCHVCWDWVEAELGLAGCRDVALLSQESFLVRHAGDFIGQALAREGAGFSPRKQTLMQLLHPAHMGRKFQVLQGWKAAARP